MGLERSVRRFFVRSRIDYLLERLGLRTAVGAVWRVLWRPSRGLHAIDVLRDYRDFRRRYGFLAQGAQFAKPDQRVLVCSLSGWIAQLKMEGMLAKALQLAGWTPVILTTRDVSLAARYHRAFGFDEQVFIEDLEGAVPRERFEAEAKRLLDQCPTFGALMECQYRGAYVGRHVLSSISRALLRTTASYHDPEVQILIRRWLPKAMRYTLAAEHLYDRVRPRYVLFTERGYLPHAEFFEVAVNRGMEAISFNHSHRTDALILRRYQSESRHMHPFSLSQESWKAVRQMAWSPQREAELAAELKGRYEQGTWFDRKFGQEGKHIKGAEEVRRQLCLDPSKKTAVIFSHVLWDATFFFGENLFDDYEQWLVETVRVAREKPEVNWIVKLHPDYAYKMKHLGRKARPRDMVALQENFGDLPAHIRILEPETDISTYSLYSVADYCLTVRGTIGIEMACNGVPVLTAGTGRYSGLGFTLDSSSREEYLARLRRIQEISPLSPEQTLLAKKHAYAVFRLRPCAFDTFEMKLMPFRKLGHPLDHNVVIRARSFADIEQAQDLRRFAAWVTGSRQADFLLPLPESVSAGTSALATRVP